MLPLLQPIVTSLFSWDLIKLFSHCTLLNSLIGLWKCDDSTRLFSQYRNHTSASDTVQYYIWITNTRWEMLAQPDWAQTGWLEWIYEHNQLFKPQLFTDNLFTIQLFILRQRPSPSHKQMKSNKDCSQMVLRRVKYGGQINCMLHIYKYLFPRNKFVVVKWIHPLKNIEETFMENFTIWIQI